MQQPPEIQPFDVDKATIDDAFMHFHTTQGGKLDKPALNTMVKKMMPTINYALGSHGSSNDPYMQSEAKVAAVEALKKFDPNKGVKLSTHVTNQLQQLHRTSKARKQTISIPERQQADMYSIQEEERKFNDEFGRDPNMAEIADRIGMPVKKIAKIKSNMYSTPGEASLPEGVEQQNVTDYRDEAMHYVYLDAPHKDKKLMEYYFGYGQAKGMAPAEVAGKLDISTSQVSRRAASLALKIQEIEDALKS